MSGEMIRLDLADIQGNIHRPYGRFGFPVTRHMFFNIANAAAGRAFVEEVRHQVTTAERWAGVDPGIVQYIQGVSKMWASDDAAQSLLRMNTCSGTLAFSGFLPKLFADVRD